MEKESGAGLIVDRVSKAFAVGLGAVYLSGFIVVMRHLARYGVSSVALLKAQYIVAGFWVLCPFVVVAVFFVAAALFLPVGDELKQLWSWPLHIRHLSRVLLSAIPLVAVIAFIQVIAELSGIGYDPDYVSHHPIALLSLLGFFVATFWSGERMVSSLRLARGGRVPATAVPKHMAGAVFYGAMCLLTFTWYILLFAERMYPLIPYTLGGGRPLPVVFQLKPQDAHQPAPVIPDSSGSRSVRYDMLLATDKTFVVLSPDEKERSIEFNRDAVIGVIVLKQPGASAGGAAR